MTAGGEAVAIRSTRWQAAGVKRQRLTRWLVTLPLLCAVAAAPASDTDDGPKPRRPHIVVFIADDLSWHDIGPYGASDVRTPHLGKLATESLRFTQVIATSPTCTPSRCSIYTGLYPFRNGAHANHSLIREGVRALPGYLKELGYRVVLAGKTHIGPREQFGFELLKGSNVMPPGKKHVLWTDLDTSVVDEFLASHDKSKPLCLIVCSHSPHVYWPEDGGKAYDPAKIQLPPYLVDTPETRAMRSRYYADVTWMDKQVGDLTASLARHGYDDHDAGTVLMFTSDQGAQWPFAKWTLYDGGVRVPLIVRWNGRVKPGTTSDALVSLADLLPTVLQAAGGDTASLAKGIDGRSFLPVLLGDKADHHDAVFATHTGDKNMNRSPARCVRTARYKYILNLLPDAPFKSHISDAEGADGRTYWRSWERLAETDPRAKLVVERYRHRPAEELYDIQVDPYEQRNLAADPAHAAELERLRARLRDWRVGQGEDLDKVAMPEDARTGPLPYAGE
jgi:N-sulfoglucosamine sulfohydrolase